MWAPTAAVSFTACFMFDTFLLHSSVALAAAYAEVP